MPAYYRLRSKSAGFEIGFLFCLPGTMCVLIWHQQNYVGPLILFQVQLATRLALATGNVGWGEVVEGKLHRKIESTHSILQKGVHHDPAKIDRQINKICIYV